MDTEFDFLKLNFNYFFNPALHSKLFKCFRLQSTFQPQATTLRKYTMQDQAAIESDLLNEEKKYRMIYSRDEFKKIESYIQEYSQSEVPDLIQLSTNESCLLYQTNEGINKPAAEFVNLMYQKRFVKAFCSYSEDLKLLHSWFLNFSIFDPDIGNSVTPTFKSIYELDASSNGTTFLSRNLLKTKLPKDSNSRLSRWSRKPLLPNQVDYAAKDAYLNCLLYDKIKKDKDEIETKNLSNQTFISPSLFSE
jgi:hypothetical protein